MAQSKIPAALLALACLLLAGNAAAQSGNATNSMSGRKLLGVAAPGGPCGSSSGNTCPSGQWCSQYGWCGVTEAHKVSCQQAYSAAGTCGNGGGGGGGGSCTSTSSPGSSCGGGKCCPSGQACSQYGWCGVTDQHKTNCQSAWSAPGTCGGTVNPTPPSGNVVRGRCNRHQPYKSPIPWGGTACQKSFYVQHSGRVTAFKYANTPSYNARCGECLRVKTARGQAYLRVVDLCGGNQDLDVSGQVGDLLVGGGGIIDCEYELVASSMCEAPF